MLLMGKLTISMAIFNSYVKLPEGNQSTDKPSTPAPRELPRVQRRAWNSARQWGVLCGGMIRSLTIFCPTKTWRSWPLQFQQHTGFFFNLKHWTDWWFWNITFIFPFSSECHHPNWLIFFRGVGIPPTSIAVLDGWIDTWMIYLYIYNHMYIYIYNYVYTT